jgi:MoxR-like ATPase
MQIIRPRAEELFHEELEVLQRADKAVKPASWKLSPWAVLQYIIGGTLENGTRISPKYIGQRSLVETAIASLLSDRALLLMGSPGTAKTWLSEHLAAAISGDSSLLIQGTSGTTEDSMRYSWNYAQLIAKGPSSGALIPSPVMKGMTEGRLVRIEELTRIPTEIQDALITILSEKNLSIPELNTEHQANRGFNIIATANDNDKGIHPISSALSRRFNILYMPLPETLKEEVQIVQQRVSQMERLMEIKLEPLKVQLTEKLVTLLRELRSGKVEDGKQKIKNSQAGLSPADAISIMHHARIESALFGTAGTMIPNISKSILQTMTKAEISEKSILQEYNETVLKKRAEWKEWYQAISDLF